MRFHLWSVLYKYQTGHGSKLIIGRTIGGEEVWTYSTSEQVLTNSVGNRPDKIDCDGQLVEILKEGRGELYLGRKLAADEYRRTELTYRVESDWKAFLKFKDTLCNCQLALKIRIKLFESAVTPCILYASRTWTMTVDNEHLFRTIRQTLLQWMI